MTLNELELRAPAARRAWIGPASIALLSLTLAAMLAITIKAPLKDDVAWLLHVAQDLLQGQRLYSDVIEINPPLIIWIMAVPAELARLTGAPPEGLTVVLLAAAVLACAGWSARILRGYGRLFDNPAPVFALIGMVLLLVPGVEFGQREHLLTAFALPYLCLLAHRQQGGITTTSEAVAVGLIAGIGVALKPRYIVAFGLLEAVAKLRGGRLQRAEILAALAFLLGYAVALALLYPAYFRVIVPFTLALYGASDVTLGRLCLESGTLLFGQAVALVMLLDRTGPLRRDPLFMVLVVFGAGATLACFLQEKDWFYHRLPATIVTVLALFYWLAAALAQPGAVSRARILALLAVACAVGAFGQAAFDRLKPRIELALQPGSSLEHRLERLIWQEHAKSYIAFSQSLSPGFPVVNETGVVWASRFDSMWPLRGALWRAREDREAAAWPVRQWVVDDFLARCPDLVVIDDRDGIDYVGALKPIPAFAEAWSRYRPVAAIDGLRVFERSAPTCR